jgi:hypothetical protein
LKSPYKVDRVQCNGVAEEIDKTSLQLFGLSNIMMKEVRHDALEIDPSIWGGDFASQMMSVK